MVSSAEVKCQSIIHNFPISPVNTEPKFESLPSTAGNVAISKESVLHFGLSKESLSGDVLFKNRFVVATSPFVMLCFCFYFQYTDLRVVNKSI